MTAIRAGALGALRVEISELREELEVLRDGLPQAQLERMRQRLSQVPEPGAPPVRLAAPHELGQSGRRAAGARPIGHTDVLGDIERSGAAPLSSPTIMERIERERASLLPPTLWEKIARERPGLLERANRPLSARAARARP